MEDLIATDGMAEVSGVLVAYLEPAMGALRHAAALGDPDAVRAHALEVAVLAGTVAVALSQVDERPAAGAARPAPHRPLRARLNRRRR